MTSLSLEGIVMPLAGLTRLTDALWLAAHDAVRSKLQIGEWALGVGLATGLVAELVHGGFVELWRGELFRTRSLDGSALPDDPALFPLLSKMADEERRVQPRPASVWAPVSGGGEQRDFPGQVYGRRDLRTPSAEGHGPISGWGHAPEEPQWVGPDTRHRRCGHDLGEWVSYLAYERCAEDLVVERLARAGLVRRQEQRRLFGGVSVRYVPADPNVSGFAAHSISSALHAGRDLTRPQLFLAGLILATGLHHYALATSTPAERAVLNRMLADGLDPVSRDLLKAADVAVGEAAMRRR
ncbi:GPP34 family phosphoprotein [Actinoplanes sp. GCM10030250]|uniref:GPP34 family phosphoprotein n=1 Tax=Actinoplanes sp. GCM10030250 TaxID=3273376 RepID=UPI0036242DE1